MRWYDREEFNVVRYAFCPGADAYEKYCNKVLKERHVNLGEYPANNDGMVISHRDKLNCPRMSLGMLFKLSLTK